MYQNKKIVWEAKERKKNHYEYILLLIRSNWFGFKNIFYSSVRVFFSLSLHFIYSRISFQLQQYCFYFKCKMLLRTFLLKWMAIANKMKCEWWLAEWLACKRGARQMGLCVCVMWTWCWNKNFIAYVNGTARGKYRMSYTYYGKATERQRKNIGWHIKRGTELIL